MSWYDFIGRNLGKIIGGMAGLLFSIFLLVFGFWKLLFIIFCVATGIFLGWCLDDMEQIRSFFNRVLNRRKD